MSLFHRDDPCTFLHEKLELFLDGELTGSENLAFQTHLKECENCAAYWSDDEEVSTALMLAVAPDRILASDRLFSTGLPPTTPARSEFDRSRDTERRSAVNASPWPKRLRTAAMAAGLAALVFSAGVFFESKRSKSLDDTKSSGQVAETKPAEIVNWRGACRVRPDTPDARDGDWRSLAADERLREGMQVLAEPNEGDLFVAVDAAAAIVLKEGSILKVARIDDPKGAVEVSLLHGQASFDFAARPFQVASPGASYEGREATFVVRSDQIEESVVVLRGDVDFRSEEEQLTLRSADRRVLRGPVRLVGAELSADEVARLESELAESRSLIADLRRDLETAKGRNLALEESLEAASAEESPRSASEIVSAYLHVVGQTNSYDLDAPSPFTKATAAKLLPFGSEAVTVIGGFFVSEEAANRRRACLGLLTELRLPESRRALERACFDRDPMMRRVALYCLTRLPDTDLGAHFLAVARADREESVRYRAALAAARQGADEGVTILVQLYHDTTDKHRRSRIVSRMARLEQELPSVSPFLRSVLLSRHSDRFSMLASISGLVARRDTEALPALRELVERADLPTDLRGRVEAAIHELEID